MKVLLNQHGLDKPFSGGIGSFKLYVLVASHVSLECIPLGAIAPLTKAYRSSFSRQAKIEQHLSLGGHDLAAEILITFLFRYGRIPDTTRGTMDSRIRTELGQHTVVTTQGSGLARGMADMSSVFQLDNSIKVFQACYFVLRRKLQKPNSDPCHSIIGYLVDAQWLRGERTECRRKIQSQPSNQQRLSNASNIPGLPENWRWNDRLGKVTPQGSPGKALEVSPKRKSPQKSAVHYDTDEEAERLKASYGVVGCSVVKTDCPSSRAATTKNKRKK